MGRKADLILPVLLLVAAQLPGTGAISGVVTDSVTQAPLAGVEIYLAPPPKPPFRYARRLTDERGRFVLVDIPPGTYAVRAERAGFADGYFGAGLNSETIAVAADSWFKTADIQLVKLGAIGGTVVDETGEPVVGAYVRVLRQFTLAGTPQIAAGPAVKTDDHGTYRFANLPLGSYIIAVPSVQHSVPAAASAGDVEGMTPNQLAARSTVGSSAPPARNGGALVDGLTALILGNYLTPPAPVGGVFQAYPVAFYPGVQSFSAAAPVELAYGSDKAGIDVTLRPVLTARVSGRLAGSPADAAGLVLRLMPRGLEDLGVGSEAATTLVRPDGSFTFLSVPVGEYVIAPGPVFEFALNAPAAGWYSSSGSNPAFGPLPATPGLGAYAQSSAGGYIAAASTGSPAATIGTNTFAPKALDKVNYARVAVTVGAGDLSGVLVPVQRTATLHCLVAFEDIKGLPPTGMLQLSAGNGSPALPGRNILHSSDEWAASAGKAIDVPSLQPGEYALGFQPIGPGPAITIKSITLDGVDASRRPIDLSDGRDATVTVTFTGKTVKLTGTLRDGSGAAVPRASVVVFPIDPQLWRNQGLTSSWIRSAVSSDRGVYDLAGIRAGEYYVIAVDASNGRPWRDPTYLVSAAAGAARVSLAWGDAKAMDVKVSNKK